jgi:hypothetical protein
MPDPDSSPTPSAAEPPGEVLPEPDPTATEPAVEPTVEPTAQPTVEPTTKPTTEPTIEPTSEPSTEPTTPSAPTAPASPTSIPTTPAPTTSVVTPAPTTAVPVPVNPGTNRSGLPWASGVYARGQGPSGIAAFATWRGRANDVVVDWPSRQTWDDVINPSWLFRTWAGTPEADAGATMAGCAAGDYNEKWRQFGSNIKTAGLDSTTIIRLGWEFNGNWYKWAAYDPGQFAQCWRQIVTSAEQTAPALRWDWNVNRGPGQSVVDARKAYPGDGYVDIVGVDSYDAWPGARDEAGWAEQYSGDYGLKFWADFAAAHGKRLSVAEWGNYPGPATAGQSGGDNPFYINKMVAFFRSQGSNLAYEAYFNESASYFAGAIFAPTQVPSAAAAYRREMK